MEIEFNEHSAMLHASCATLLTFVQPHRQALFSEEGLHVMAELLQRPLRKLNLHPMATPQQGTTASFIACSTRKKPRDPPSASRE